MQLSVGMAIQITKENVEKLSVVNGGVVPRMEKNKITFFVFPYDYNRSCEILSADTFYRIYEFANIPSPDTFVDINRL